MRLVVDFAISRAAPPLVSDAIVTVRTHGRYDGSIPLQFNGISFRQRAPWLPQCLAPQESPAVFIAIMVDVDMPVRMPQGSFHHGRASW